MALDVAYGTNAAASGGRRQCSAEWVASVKSRRAEHDDVSSGTKSGGGARMAIWLSALFLPAGKKGRLFRKAKKCLAEARRRRAGNLPLAETIFTGTERFGC